ncbi:MAG: fibronectin type III domain-containing protein [Spirochaetes bacterium]|nr:fibronectin type III domain-containing protein [Spirochaetota bacterium]
MRFSTALLAAGIVTLYMEPTRGAITLLVCTPENPTLLANGNRYYLAGRTYDFEVRVVEPSAVNWGSINYVDLTIPNGTNIVLHYVPSTDTSSVTSGGVTVTHTRTGTYDDFTVTFHVTFPWNMPESVWAAARAITASADSDFPPTPVNFTANTSYGVCATVKWLDAAQDGEAADGWVSNVTPVPYRAGSFNVTGTLAYNVLGATTADSIDSIDPGEVTGTTLLLDGATTADTAGATSALAFTVPNTFSIPGQAAAHNWNVQAAMTTAGGPVTTANGTLLLRSDEVQITDIVIFGGGGITTNAGPPQRRYYRSVPVAGAMMRVTARMRHAAINVVGDTTVNLETSAGVAAGSVTIPSGTATWDAALTYPLAAAAPVGDTTLILYRAASVSGGVTGNAQTSYDRITQETGANCSGIFWDNVDPPGVTGGSFTTPAPTHSESATTFTLNWNYPDDTCTTAACPNGDFSTYKVYYKLSTDATYTTVDKNTATYGYLGTLTSASTEITGLQPLTNYDYIFSALDIFGNEVAGGDRPGDTITTTATGIELTLTDGVTSYALNTVNSPAPDLDPVTNYPLRRVNVHAAMKVTTAGDIQRVRLVVAANEALENNTQYGTGADVGQFTNDDIDHLTEGTTKWSYDCTRNPMNKLKWDGYIPDSCPAMVTGQKVRFIVELTVSGTPSYQDRQTETAGGNHWSNEWRFYVSKDVNVVPYPTRVLNNVLTRTSPVCYPTYYLSSDAIVTIKVFDIQGKTVAILLDSVYRKSGQNIREGGWYGVNKNGRKVGPGLYYIHIKAESGSRTLIDKYNKVVVAW